MPDYKAIYYKLFHAVTDAINALQAAQREAEAIYIDSDEPPFTEPQIEQGGEQNKAH